MSGRVLSAIRVVCPDAFSGPVRGRGSGFGLLLPGNLCYGFQMIPNPGEPAYHSLLHTLRLIRFVAASCPEFTLNERMDSLAGSEAVMAWLRGESSYEALREAIKTDEQKWLRKAKKYLLYDEALYRVK